MSAAHPFDPLQAVHAGHLQVEKNQIQTDRRIRHGEGVIEIGCIENGGRGIEFVKERLQTIPN